MSLEKVYLGGGCFWCLEAVYQQVAGVQSVVSGYMGGHIKNPCYREVCTGMTGHAEVVEIVFDTDIICFEDILEIFWNIHDPTTLNRQGADKGTQYRSVVFCTTDTQLQKAVISKHETGQSLWADPIVTEIKPAEVFYPAEDYHQNYFNDHPEQSYCSIVIAPKISKFRKQFSDKLNITKHEQ